MKQGLISYRDNGKANGNYRDYKGYISYRDNGKELGFPKKIYFLFRGLRFPRREQTSFGVLELVTESYSTYATVFLLLLSVRTS